MEEPEEIPTMRSCSLSKYSVSTVSSVRQTIRLGGNIKSSLILSPRHHRYQTPASSRRTAKRRRTKQPSDRRQPALLLPLTGDRKRNQPPSADWAVSRIKKRSKGA